MKTYKDDIKQVFHLDLPWEKLSGCNILVTGATGLIGGCLVDTLLANPQRDYDVYASGRNEERAQKRFAEHFANGILHFVKYDVMVPLQSDIRFDYIIHAASGANPLEYAKRPVEVMKSNINGVSNLMDYGREHGMRRFLYVSSGEVYGEGDGREFTEDFSGFVNITSSRSCYPSSKRAAETLCAAYAAEYGVDVVIARPCHIYGPHFIESDNRVFAQFIRNVLRDEDIVMKSTGEQFRSWCYVVDCVSAILYILLKGEKVEAYNIADSNSIISIKDLAEMIAAIGGKKVIFEIPDAIEKSGYNVVDRSVFSTIKLNKLGWHSHGDMRRNLYVSIMSNMKK